MPCQRRNAYTHPRPEIYHYNSPVPTAPWKLGDIAFLRKSDDFNDAERAKYLDSGRILPRATGHPVIILAQSLDAEYYIVTTVSAYSSSAQNNYLPPWQQEVHARKDINGFRAFAGCARPNTTHDYLHLTNNMAWPKPKTSWVYVNFPCLVPKSLLITYDKTPHRLRMTPQSFKDLLNHVGKSGAFKRKHQELMAINSRTNRKPVTRDLQENWRRNEKAATNNQPWLPVNVARVPLKPCTNMNTVPTITRSWASIASS